MKKIAIIGGTSGIGASLVETLSPNEYHITTMSRSENSEADQHFQVDITDEQPNFPAFEDGLDGLVYCPGSINLKPFGSLKIKDFEADFNINVLGLIKSLQHFQAALKKSEGASVVLFSTVAVQTGMSFHASVAASKGAVEGVARSLAAEWAPNIRVNVIAPSLTETPLAARLLRNDKQREASVNRHPLKKIGKAEDSANMAAFLLSQKSAWITGQIFQIDGGMSSIKMM